MSEVSPLTTTIMEQDPIINIMNKVRVTIPQGMEHGKHILGLLHQYLTYNQERLRTSSEVSELIYLGSFSLRAKKANQEDLPKVIMDVITYSITTFALYGERVLTSEMAAMVYRFILNNPEPIAAFEKYLLDHGAVFQSV